MNTNDQTTTPRKGLVLEGGGAKGAYAFGWLMEFAERGIRFDAVAGTSVGALNAVLWASGQIREGEVVWRTISEQTTLAMRRPRWLWSLVIVPYALHRWLGERISSFEDHVLLSYTALALAAAVVVPSLWAPTELARQAILSAAMLVNPTSGIGELGAGILQAFQWSLILFGVLLAMLTVMFPGVADGVVRFSWRSSLPLKSTITRLLTGKSIAMPAYATVAEYREVCDPEHLRFWRGKAAPLGYWHGFDRYVPAYIPLHTTQPERLAELVLASASLPYGITLPVRDSQRVLVDGGVVDNSPTTPLISDEKCDLIVVIKLRHESRPTTTEQIARFRRLARLRIAAALTAAEASRMRAEGASLAVEEPASCPEIRTIVPSSPLGTLLSTDRGRGRKRSRAIAEFRAMLTFEPGFVSRLIALGRADAAAQPPQFWEQLARQGDGKPSAGCT